MANIERFMAGPLMWTTNGDIWGMWRLTPLPRPATEHQSDQVAWSHAALYRALSGREFCLNGILSWTDPRQIVDAMTTITEADGQTRIIDLDAHPVWADEIDAFLNGVAATEPLGRREWFLSVKLPIGSQAATRAHLSAAANTLCDWAGLMPLPPAAAEVAAARAAFTRLSETLPDAFAPRPASEGEQLWLRHHFASRTQGLADEHHTVSTSDELPEPTGSFHLGGETLDEGAISDLAGRPSGARAAAIPGRRVLKVTSADENTSYQSRFVLGQVPRQMVWPATEFLGRIDDTGVPVDLTIRGVVRSRHEAMRKNQTAIRRVNDQLDSVEGAELSQAGAMMRIQHGAQTLADYNAVLDADQREVEIAPLVIASIADTSYQNLTDLAAQFAKAEIWDEFTWLRPIGRQTALYWAERPGTILSRSLNEYRQLVTGLNFAAAIPMTDYRLGRDAGIPLAVVTASPLASIVYLDLAADTYDRLSGTVALIGEMGAGKTMAEKRLTAAIVARGGRMIATDNSEEREWFTFWNAVDCTRQMVDTEHPELSVDPLRILDPAQAGRVMQSFLITLLNLDATGTSGQTLAKVLKPGYLARHHITSAGALQRHLADGCDLPAAAEIADRIAVFADPDMSGSRAAAVFDESLPALDITADAIIIGTHGVTLPTATEIDQEHLFRQLAPEKIFGRALYALIAVLAREVCFSDRSRPAVFDIDEFHVLASSPEATKPVQDFVREGRRGMAWLITGSHDPEADYPDETIRDLIKHRIVLRLTKPELAKKGVKFLGIDPKDSPEEFNEYVAAVQQIDPHHPGEGLYADQWGTISTIQLLPPAYGPHLAAAQSDPPTATESEPAPPESPQEAA